MLRKEGTNLAHVLRLMTLRLRNFKGIREMTLDARGGNVSVYGDNATGKTTLADAFMWLLFDKDSLNRKDFEIKTLDGNGQVLHNLEHEVEGMLEVDGRLITLRKVYKETWTKKRGSATAEHTGHTTDHYIDGVPVSKGEYQDRIKTLADESRFRLLTDPRFFNEQLHWKERRSLLLEVCGDVTDTEVIASDPKLADLPNILQGRRLADHRKVIEARRKEINEKLREVPVRIDQETRGLPEVTGTRDTVETELTMRRQQRQDKSAELVRIDQGGETAEKRRRLQEVEGDLLTLANRLRQEADKTVQQERSKLTDIQAQIDEKRREHRLLWHHRDEGDRKAKQLEARLQALRQEWQTIKERTLTLSVEETCPACGQDLPTDKVEGARANAETQFNLKQSADMEANVTEGRRLKGELDTLLADQQRRAEAMDQLERTISTLTEQETELQGRINRMREQTPDWTQNPEYQAMDQTRRTLGEELTALRSGADQARATVQAELADLDAQIRTLEGALARFDQRTAGLKRIDDLQAQEKALAREYERLERELYLTDEFVRVKVRMLTDRINGRFQHARFKLFDVLVNGGVEECCETLFHGVPYSNLNNGAKINIGLDVLNTLSEHYGFTAPVWVDNSEAVTRLQPTRSQVIRLVVSAPDQRLRVETEAPATIKEAV